MKDVYYRQCELIKKIDANLVERDTCWIPEKYAVYGDILKIRQNGEWTDGWYVSEVGIKLLESLIPNPHSMTKTHRKQTGDSLPKVKE